jgi:molybdate/tungstate transport system ATP-binding protein
LLQKPVFFKGTVKDNLLMGLKFRKVDDLQQKQRLEKISELFDLGSLLERSPLELSGGERQRVHLARAFILEPEFLFLDEPFNGLDVQFWEEIIADFYRIRKTTGVTTILVTHLRQEAAFLADRLAVMLSGRIVQVGSLEEVVSAPASAEISRLMGQETLVEGVVEDSENGFLRILAHGQTVYAFGQQKNGERVVLTFRPEEVILAPEKPSTSVRNWFYCQVSELRPFDRMILVSLVCGFRLRAYVSRTSVEELRLEPGRKVWAGVKASALTTWPGYQTQGSNSGSGE